MPTQLNRIQCLMNPELHAQVKALAVHNKRSLSAMVAELIEHSLSQPAYQQQLQAAELVEPEPDPRKSQHQAQYRAASAEAAVLSGVDLNNNRLSKLRMLLDLLEGD